MTKTLQKVSMELGATINMGNYQSLKVSIGGEMNILPGGLERIAMMSYRSI